jgi:hypothetical protein
MNPLSSNIRICSFILLILLSLILYIPHVYGGLHLLILSFQFSFIPRESWPFLPEWSNAVWCLAAANAFHQVMFYNMFCGIASVCVWVIVVLSLEEIALRTGWIFGTYWFTDELGPKMSPHLPSLVLALWCSLIYPTMLLTNTILDGNPFHVPHPNRVKWYAALAALLLTVFDVVSEPPAIIYGHKMWNYFASYDAANFRIEYESVPDWIFGPNQFLSFYYGIPLQVSFLLLISSVFLRSHHKLLLAELPRLVINWIYYLLYLLQPTEPTSI